MNNLRAFFPIVSFLVAGMFVAAGPAEAVPIAPIGPSPTLPAFSGKTAKPTAVKGSTRAPQNPFLAPNPFSGIHNDTWMTDTYPGAGPTGRNLATDSESARPGICSAITFDSRGRIVTVCPAAVFPPQARIIDPDSLEVIDTYDLPNAPDLPGTVQYQNFAGGGYFYLDNRDRIWVATKTNHLFVLGQTADGHEFKLVKDYDLTSKFNPAKVRISSALPDYKGRVWIVAKQTGQVGVLDRRPEDPVDRLNEPESELVRGRPQGRLHRLRQAHVPLRAHQKGLPQGRVEEPSTETAGSSSRARRTPAPAPPRPSSRAATLRSPTTPPA